MGTGHWLCISVTTEGARNYSQPHSRITYALQNLSTVPGRFMQTIPYVKVVSCIIQGTFTPTRANIDEEVCCGADVCCLYGHLNKAGVFLEAIIVKRS